MPNEAMLLENLSETAVKNITAWLFEPKYAEYKDELLGLIQQEKWQLLEDSFFKVIEFGTAGRRGTTGVGSNRINKVTIGESAQALCEYIVSLDKKAAEKGIVIACDTRLSSPELSRYAARVCAGNGFKTYMFDGYRSTPELSFAVRHLGAAAGIVISASHNPPADNGFKVCWSDGGQLVAPHDKGVLKIAESLKKINVADFNEAKTKGHIVLVGKEVDDAYIAAASAQTEGTARDIKIVYSPLHGAGQTNVLPVLKAAGFNDISVVEAQMIPDGNFPTIPNGKPNPEEKSANDMAVAQLHADQADIAITNDPDADRFGVVVRSGQDSVYLTGNQSAALATDYALFKMQQKGALTPKHYIAKTIVTTDMLVALAQKYGVLCYGNMLIGFKYIGELIRKKEATDEVFVLGGEESFGLLKGDYARDKDGATGALPLAEYAAELKQQDMTLYDRLLELYREHGMYTEYLANAYFEGASGFEKMQKVMSALRANPPGEVAGHTITAVLDYNTLVRRETATGKQATIDCVRGNVVVFEFDNDPRRRVTIRPSGTEPKLKFYVQWFDEARADVGGQYKETLIFLEKIATAMEELVLQ